MVRLCGLATLPRVAAHLYEYLRTARYLCRVWQGRTENVCKRGTAKVMCYGHMYTVITNTLLSCFLYPSPPTRNNT